MRRGLTKVLNRRHSSSASLKASWQKRRFTCYLSLLCNEQPFTYHVDATMKTVVNFVMPDNWIATRSNLYTSQSIPIDIIVFNQTAAISKNVDTTLMTIVDLIFPAKQSIFVSDYPQHNIRNCQLKAQQNK
jgi:hypothetical protein